MNARLTNGLLVLALLTPVFTAIATSILSQDSMVLARVISPWQNTTVGGVLNAEDVHTTLYAQLAHGGR